jgi:hypothetical protein
MPKPELPPTPPALRERAYKPSGKNSSYCTPLMLVLGLPISIGIGIVGLPWWRASIDIVSNQQGSSFWYSLGTILGALFFTFLATAVAGGAVGYLLRLIVIWCKCRAPKICTKVSAVVGVTGALAFFVNFVAFAITGGVFWLYYLFAVIYSIVFASAVAVIPTGYIEKTPFCEQCQKWFRNYAKGKLSLKSAEALTQFLETDSLNIQNIGIAALDDGDFLEVKLRRCLSCTESNAEITVKVAWKEKKDIKYKEWLVIMLPLEKAMAIADLIKK